MARGPADGRLDASGYCAHGEQQVTTGQRHRTRLLAAGITLLLAACSAASAPTAGSLPNEATTPPTTAATASSEGGSNPAPVSPPSTATGGSLDPCSLLTQSEVDAAAGQPLGHGNQIGALLDCQWSTSDFAASLELDIGDWSAMQTKAAESGQTLTPVSGIGDEALAVNGAGNAAQLYVRKGNTGFLLLLGGQYLDSLADFGLAREKHCRSCPGATVTRP